MARVLDISPKNRVSIIKIHRNLIKIAHVISPFAREARRKKQHAMETALRLQGGTNLVKAMRGQTQISLLAAVILVGCLVFPTRARAGSTAGSDPSVKQMMRQVEQRLDTVEQENRSLREQVLELKQQVNTQAPTVSAMQQHLTQDMPKTEQRVANMEKMQEASDRQMASLKLHEELPFKGSGLGFRAGWSEVPFDLPGGFYWDLHLGHRLFEERD